jgi:hypothetical protein
MFKWRELMQQITFKRAANLAGSTHTWVAESDGSARKLREMIKKDL